MSVEIIIHTETFAWRRALSSRGLNALAHCYIAMMTEYDCVKALTGLDKTQYSASIPGPCHRTAKVLM